MVERLMEWLAAPVVAAQRERIQRAARAVRRSQRAARRLDRLASAYRQADEALHR